MILTIVGYLGYFVLLFLAITWGIGVRKQLDASIWTIFGAFLFFISAVILSFSKINLLHSFWIIAVVYIITLIIPFIYAYNIPILKSFITIFASLYANLIRIGIDKKIIRQSAENSTRAFVKEWAEKKNGDNLETIIKLWLSECIAKIDTAKLNEPRPLVGACCFFIGSIDNLCQIKNIDDKSFAKYSIDILTQFNFPKEVISAILNNYFGKNLRVEFATNAMFEGGRSFNKWIQSNYTSDDAKNNFSTLVNKWFKNPDLTPDELPLFGITK